MYGCECVYESKAFDIEYPERRGIFLCSFFGHFSLDCRPFYQYTMPSFAFWKSSKTDEAKAPLLTPNTDEHDVEMKLVAKDLDLNTGNEDSGVFLFVEEDLPPTAPKLSDVDPGSKEVSQGRAGVTRESDASIAASLLNAGAIAHDRAGIAGEGRLRGSPSTNNGKHASPLPASLSKHELLLVDPTATTHSSLVDEDIESVQQIQEPSIQQTNPVFQLSEQTSATKTMSTRPESAMSQRTTTSSARDSGVELFDDDSLPPQSRPTSLAMSDSSPRSRKSSLSSKHTTPTKPSPSPLRTDSIPRRLHRPTELNLGLNSVASTARPRSELEQRYDLIRNSTTQSKAALRSPTALLQERLNKSPKKHEVEEKVHVFTPPKPIANGCWLPGPGAQMDAFTSTSVRARTEAGGRPAWWCKFDKLVVFDGIDIQDVGLKIHTRTSKGLRIARRRGDMETIVIPMDCAHCQEMLNRHEWKYDMRVCKRSVCWDCKERCKWEMEEEKRIQDIEMSTETTELKTEGNRYRADSLLQDEQDRGVGLTGKVCI
jgi:hypothetical protein